MKKLLLLLLCVPLLFSCGESKEDKDKGNLNKEITREMMDDGYTGLGTDMHIVQWGEKYVGEFKNGKRHGQGTYTWADGEKYVGEWKDGKYHGQGNMTYFNGSKYVGEWKENNWHGQGTYTYAYGKEVRVENGTIINNANK